MYVRTKKSSRNNNIYIQLVESYREKGRIKQRMVKHIGTAKTSEEVNQLKQLAQLIKAEMIREEHKPSVKGKYAKQVGLLTPPDLSTKLTIASLKEESRQILGIHDIYGFIYEALDFTNLLSRPKQNEKAAQILREIILARIAQPESKRSSVTLLETQFGISLKLEQVYRMMDKLDDKVCERIQQRALSSAIKLTGEKIKVLFYDATTLYFESFTEDSLKQNGYSKDMKFNQPQVLLALFVTEKGLPVGYEVFPGSTYEGHTLKMVLEKLKSRYNVEEVIFVADRGMFNKDNLSFLDENRLHYVVGSRIKNLKKSHKQAIIDWSIRLDKEKVENEVTHEMMLTDTQRLILSYSIKRAHKDKADRQRAIQKLKTRLSSSKNPKQLISNYGFQKFISVKGDATLQIDQGKLEQEVVWDGIVGVVTNHPQLNHQQVLVQYHGLWQVEESFRINKHDLRIRPIYHWTPKRIKAHILISFMAFTCVRYLEYRVSRQYKKMSPEQIRTCLMQVQASIIQDISTKKHYLLPSSINVTAKQIYRIFNIKIPQGVLKINF